MLCVDCSLSAWSHITHFPHVVQRASCEHCPSGPPCSAQTPFILRCPPNHALSFFPLFLYDHEQDRLLDSATNKGGTLPTEQHQQQQARLHSGAHQLVADMLACLLRNLLLESHKPVLEASRRAWHHLVSQVRAAGHSRPVRQRAPPPENTHVAVCLDGV